MYEFFFYSQDFVFAVICKLKEFLLYLEIEHFPNAKAQYFQEHNTPVTHAYYIQ